MSIDGPSSSCRHSRSRVSAPAFAAACSSSSPCRLYDGATIPSLGDGSGSANAGQPLSHEKADIPGADAVRYAEGHTKGRAIVSSPTTRRGRRPWHVQTLFVREPGGLVVDQGGTPPLVRIGKARSRSR